MACRFSFLSLFPDFHSSGVSNKELEEIISQAILEEFPDDEIDQINYYEDGISFVLKSGGVVDVDIDWNEIILV